MDDKGFSPLDAVRSMSGSYLFGDGTPCPVLVEPRTLERVWVVSGENAGGKSLFCRALQQIVAADSKEAGSPVEVMRVGMDMRTQSGVLRGMMFGSEQDDSTGKNSVQTLLTGISTARSRTNPHWLVLDEPDVGVGEGYRHAIGELFASFATDLPDNTLGFFVVTHAREIAAPMIRAGASSVRIGDDLRPVEEWLREGDLPKTVDDLRELSRKGTERFRAIGSVLRDIPKEERRHRGPGRG